jgi:hypothetical protein
MSYTYLLNDRCPIVGYVELFHDNSLPQSVHKVHLQEKEGHREALFVRRVYYIFELIH